jgi:hypothetical protein
MDEATALNMSATVKGLFQGVENEARMRGA